MFAPHRAQMNGPPDSRNRLPSDLTRDIRAERLLGLVQRLMARINQIDQAGFLDASILGETVHPRNFNTIKRIGDEDNAVIDEEEQFAELASNEFLMKQVLNLLRAQGKEMLEALPYGIHSGLVKPGAKGDSISGNTTTLRPARSPITATSSPI